MDRCPNGSTPTKEAIASEFIDVGVVETEVAPVKRILSGPIAMLSVVLGWRTRKSDNIPARWLRRCGRWGLRKYGSGCTSSDTYVVGFRLSEWVSASAVAWDCARRVLPCANASRRIDLRSPYSCSSNLRMSSKTLLRRVSRSPRT